MQTRPPRTSRNTHITGCRWCHWSRSLLLLQMLHTLSSRPYIIFKLYSLIYYNLTFFTSVSKPLFLCERHRIRSSGYSQLKQDYLIWSSGYSCNPLRYLLIAITSPQFIWLKETDCHNFPSYLTTYSLLFLLILFCCYGLSAPVPSAAIPRSNNIKFLLPPEVQEPLPVHQLKKNPVNGCQSLIVICQHLWVALQWHLQSQISFSIGICENIILIIPPPKQRCLTTAWCCFISTSVPFQTVLHKYAVLKIFAVGAARPASGITYPAFLFLTSLNFAGISVFITSEKSIKPSLPIIFLLTFYTIKTSDTKLSSNETNLLFYKSVPLHTMQFYGKSVLLRKADQKCYPLHAGSSGTLVLSASKLSFITFRQFSCISVRCENTHKLRFMMY